MIRRVSERQRGEGRGSAGRGDPAVIMIEGRKQHFWKTFNELQTRMQEELLTFRYPRRRRTGTHNS